MELNNINSLVELFFEKYKEKKEFADQPFLNWLKTKEDNLNQILASGQTRDYTITMSDQLNTGGDMSENAFKQLSNTAEHLKRLFAPDNNANVTDYWFNGRVENVTYERDEEDESKIRAIITFNCTGLEAS